VAPNNTVGSLVIPEGLAQYSALVMAERKYGVGSIKNIVQDQLWLYLYIRSRLENKEHPLIKADKWFEWGGKASVALYGLRDLIGEDSINAALREFKDAYAFKTNGPFAGANDLYRYLDKHVPDSLKYYLIDTWQKITLYDNKVTEVTSVPTGNNNEYKVTMTVDVNKAWIDDKGNDIPATSTNDYIYIGVFAKDSKNQIGRWQSNPLYLNKHRLTMGKHTFSLVVKGKPESVGIDPYALLIDRQPNDNMKAINQ
jgi:ABC-2 type transport system permease protein